MRLPFYESNLIPAAPVEHGYRNFWLRDGWYVGICSNKEDKDKLWAGMIGIADRYKDKLAYHGSVRPAHWYEYFHIRYSPEGFELSDAESIGWQHNQFDSTANLGEVCLDVGRLDLAKLFVDYTARCTPHKSATAGMWEDKNTPDAYSIAACIHFLQRAKYFLPNQRSHIEELVFVYTIRLYRMLANIIRYRKACLSLLGICWPYNLAGPFHQDIVDLVCEKLKREPFGFIRYEGDTYDGHGFSRTRGTEIPWLLGDLFMAHIEPDNARWLDRILAAKQHFGCMPEGYFQETMAPNRNTPLIWAEALFDNAILNR